MKSQMTSLTKTLNDGFQVKGLSSLEMAKVQSGLECLRIKIVEGG